MKHVEGAIERLLSAIYPSRCALCGLTAPNPICAICFDEFEAIKEPITVFGSKEPLEFAAHLFRYTTRAAQAVQLLKYAGRTSLVEPLATVIAERAAELSLDEADLIIPVPLHWRRKMMRGFNQSELLASKVSPKKLRPNYLVRIKNTKQQVGLTSFERLANQIGAFRAHDDVRNQHILLIDDVFTTGGTATSCAIALCDKGAASVGILTLTGSGNDSDSA